MDGPDLLSRATLLFYQGVMDFFGIFTAFAAEITIVVRLFNAGIP